MGGRADSVAIPLRRQNLTKNRKGKQADREVDA